MKNNISDFISNKAKVKLQFIVIFFASLILITKNLYLSGYEKYNAIVNLNGTGETEYVMLMKESITFYNNVYSIISIILLLLIFVFINKIKKDI